jgi:O-methyltransferase
MTPSVGEALRGRARRSLYATQKGALRRTRPKLARALEATDEYSLLAPRKRIALYEAGREVLERNLPGDFAEIGVHRGGGIGMLGTDLRGTGRNLHLFDRWGDLPEATDRDGDFASLVTAETIPQMLEDSGASEAQAAARELLIDRLGMSPEHVTFHAGWFDQTLPAYTGGPVAFAHVDADFYDSTRLAFDFLERHMTDRALVVLDDWKEWPGVRSAYEEFSSRTTRRLELRPSRQQAIVRVGEW